MLTQYFMSEHFGGSGPGGQASGSQRLLTASGAGDLQSSPQPHLPGRSAQGAPADRLPNAIAPTLLAGAGAFGQLLCAPTY